MGQRLARFALDCSYPNVADELEKALGAHMKIGLKQGQCQDTYAPEHVPCDPESTVVLIDWDDTLLCSTAINRASWSEHHLRKLEEHVEALLLLAMTLGDTYIVTNGNATWVNDSSSYFLPGLVGVLQRLPIISARAKYERLFPGDPVQWKRQAFKDILWSWRDSQEETRRGVNLIAIGDSFAEIWAAEQATKVLPGRSLVKTVKLQELPTANQLLGQLRRLQRDFRSIVQLSTSTKKQLVPRALANSNYMGLSACASAWRVCDRQPLGQKGTLATLIGF